MLKIHKDQRTLSRLEQLTLTPTASTEPFPLKELVLASPNEIFSEIRYEIFVITSNVNVSEDLRVKCDLLGIDPQGQAVIVVVSSGEQASPLVRGITCAGLIARWKQDDFFRHLSDERIQDLGSYLSVDTTGINRQQRVVFLGESFRSEDLTAAGWLRAHGIDVACIRVSRAVGFEADGEYLWCTRVSADSPDAQSLALAQREGSFNVQVGPQSEREALPPRQLEEEIAARKQAEQALRASEDRYWTLARLSPVGIFHTDAEGNLLYVNDRWCEMAGLSQEEAQGQGWARALHSDDRDRVLNDWHDTTEQSLPFKAEYRFQRPDGGTSWVLGEAAVQRDEEGKVSGYVGTVTELHRVDAAGGGPFAARRR